MIITEKINGLIFLEQRTYYVYRNEEDRANGNHVLMLSEEDKFNANKALAREKEDHCDPDNKFIVF